MDECDRILRLLEDLRRTVISDENETWSNRETRTMAVWIDSDESAHEMVKDLAEVSKKEFEVKGGDIQAILAEKLHKWRRHEIPEVGPSVWTDLMESALSEVDWKGLAGHYLNQKGGV